MITDHLNHCFDLIPEKEKKIAAGLNLESGKRAKKSTAYDTSIVYLEKGIEFIGKDPWTKDYNLTLNFYIEAAETTYLKGYFGLMENIAGGVMIMP